MSIARADRAALLLALALAATAAAADLGTLFHSRDERMRLDAARRGEPVREPSAAEAPARTPRVTGYVKRSDGRDTVWVDGVPIAGAPKDAARDLEPRVVRPAQEPAQGGVKVERKPPA